MNILGLGQTRVLKVVFLFPCQDEGYQSKQMCTNKKLNFHRGEALAQTGKRADCLEGARVPPFAISRNLLGLQLNKVLRCQIRLQFNLFTAHLRKGSADKRQGAVIIPAVLSAVLGGEGERNEISYPLKSLSKTKSNSVD